MLNLGLIINRLRQADVCAELIEGAAGLSVFGGQYPADTPRGLPAIYVIPESEAPSQNQFINAVSQMVTVTFGVVTVVQNLEDVRGEAAGRDLNSVREEVRQALQGWQISSVYSPILRRNGRSLKFPDQLLWWQDNYSLEYLEQIYG